MWCTFILLGFLAFSHLGSASSIFLDEKWKSGYINVDSTHSLFYWLFKARHPNTANPPLVLWLQGGPGCSGVTNVLNENGPFRITESLALEYNPFSWNNKVDVLYVDQPLGTGFSTCSDINRIPRNEAEVSKDLKAFLDNFVGKHPEYSGRDFYMTGQSFAGHYVPSLAKYLLDLKVTNLKLKGIAIGNGWYKPEAQIMSFPSFDIEHGLIKGPLEWLGATVSYYLTSIFVQLDWYRAAQLFFRFGSGIANGIIPRFNMYDIRKPCVGPLCYNSTLLENFMKRKDVLQELGVDNIAWEECSMTVFEHMTDQDYFSDMSDTLRALLDSHKSLKVILYNGNQDWICNIDGMKMYMNSFEWSGKSVYETAPWQHWFVSGKAAGMYKKAGNFTFYEVNDAGHLVCYDQPEFGYDILTTLIKQD